VLRNIDKNFQNRGDRPLVFLPNFTAKSQYSYFCYNPTVISAEFFLGGKGGRGENTVLPSLGRKTLGGLSPPQWKILAPLLRRSYFPYRKLEKLFFFYEQIERLSLCISMLFDHYSIGLIIIKLWLDLFLLHICW
jgi:hypothetical protein